MKQQEFKLKKQLLELEHNNKLKQLEFELKCKREFVLFQFEREMEKERLRNANIKRNILSKENIDFMKNYSQGGKDGKGN